MILIKYVGGLDGVDVVLPSGRTVTAMRDEVISYLPNEAEILLDSPEWEVVNGDTDDLKKITKEAS